MLPGARVWSCPVPSPGLPAQHRNGLSSFLTLNWVGLNNRNRNSPVEPGDNIQCYNVASNGDKSWYSQLKNNNCKILPELQSSWHDGESPAQGMVMTIICYRQIWRSGVSVKGWGGSNGVLNDSSHPTNLESAQLLWSSPLELLLLLSHFSKFCIFGFKIQFIIIRY